MLVERHLRVRWLLLQVGDTVTVARRDDARVRARASGKDAKQRRLADAVGTDETGAVAVSEDERCVVEERFGVVRRTE
jgi:hypothetical protein